MKTRQPPHGTGAYRTPGLYFDWRAGEVEVPPAASSGVPLFVGLTGGGNVRAEGPALYRFTRWQQFEQAFAADGVSALLACAVRGFFENGGRLCYLKPADADAPATPDGQKLADAIAAPFEPRGMLDDLEDIDLVCVPDIMRPEIAQSSARVFDLQARVVEYCARMGERFAILDAYAGNPANVTEHGADAMLIDSIGQWQTLPPNYGAIYFPWIRVVDHRASSRTSSGLLVPPCGHVAGVYARSDRRDGVHKPPANEVLEGALDLGYVIGDSEQALLNDAGVNCLRESRGWGIRVWGARTLSDRPAWRYVNVTRVMLALTRWLEYNMRDLVFEPNGVPLWTLTAERLKRYCSELFRRGALKGDSEADAYFVKCDAETNAQFSRDSGIVVAEVGLAPAAPSEFVIVRITQSASGVNITVPTAWQ
ncbi:phage tail sheath family protein [Trinickia violacea]|uniref:Phage tail sheath family protein n=1 Tax=Trinickia violacea TaxID=2571746 RepID=A0A4P8IQB6_9BURK|nr:phage tail sheath subtilisin-like domain-containing protein [Trinickia violacea]QCP49815.1 phage tail sheath family protein [Trinickia violacea]